MPALKAQGLSLQGDLQRSRGDAAGARRTYSEAAAIRPSPSINARLSAVATAGAPGDGRVVPKGRIPPGAVVVPKKQP